MKLTFVSISDTHNQHEYLVIPDADLIIHSGDATGTGTQKQVREFCEWYGNLPHKHKILIAGNHDWLFQEEPEKARKYCEDNGIIYLEDSGCEIEGIKFWGSPQTPEFCNWAFNCWRTEEEWLNDKLLKDETFEYKGHTFGRNHGYKGYDFIGKYWDMIPEDTDFLITHGPPKGILDLCQSGNVGCDLLLEKVKEIKPKFHQFGHIHETRGEIEEDGITFINASSLDGGYKPYIYDIQVREIENVDR